MVCAGATRDRESTKHGLPTSQIPVSSRPSSTDKETMTSLAAGNQVGDAMTVLWNDGPETRVGYGYVVAEAPFAVEIEGEAWPSAAAEVRLVRDQGERWVAGSATVDVSDEGPARHAAHVAWEEPSQRDPRPDGGRVANDPSHSGRPRHAGDVRDRADVGREPGRRGPVQMERDARGGLARRVASACPPGERSPCGRSASSCGVRASASGSRSCTCGARATSRPSATSSIAERRDGKWGASCDGAA